MHLDGQGKGGAWLEREDRLWNQDLGSSPDFTHTGVALGKLLTLPKLQFLTLNGNGAVPTASSECWCHTINDYPLTRVARFSK